MKAAACLLILISLILPVELLANDQEVLHEDEFEVFVSAHFASEMNIREEETPEVHVVIYDVNGNLLRSSDIPAEDLMKPGSILWPLIHKSHFLTSVDGKVYYLFN